MAHLICPGCKAEVDELTTTCPKCGVRLGEIRREREQQRASSSWLITMLIVAIGLAILFFKGIR
jgi:hypothetical protein